MIIKKIFIYLLYPILLFFKKIFSRKPQLRVLIFHYITRDQYKKFENLIIQLNKNFQIISPNEFKEIINGNKKIYNDSILISFDDGYKSQFKASKILDKYKIKAIFFITLNFVKLKSKKKVKQFLKNNLGVGKFFHKDFLNIKNMNFSDVNNLLKSGHKVGAHTFNHSDLSKVTLREQKKEIVQYKKFFYKQFNSRDIKNFAFTFGGVKNLNHSSINIALNSYNFVHTGIRGNNYNNKQKLIFRDNCDLHLSCREIFFFLNGFGDFYYAFKRHNLNKILKKIPYKKLNV